MEILALQVIRYSFLFSKENAEKHSNDITNFVRLEVRYSSALDYFTLTICSHVAQGIEEPRYKKCAAIFRRNSCKKLTLRYIFILDKVERD